MTHLKMFLDMLNQANIGHGTQQDFNPEGTSVRVECENRDEVEFWFDSDGKFMAVYSCQDDI